MIVNTSCQNKTPYQLRAEKILCLRQRGKTLLYVFLLNSPDVFLGQLQTCIHTLSLLGTGIHIWSSVTFLSSIQFSFS